MKKKSFVVLLVIVAVGLLLSSGVVLFSEDKDSNSPTTMNFGRKVGFASTLVYLKAISAVASSFDDTPDWAPPPVAIAGSDGDLLTRWSSKLGLDNQWIYFDLGKPKAINKVVIHWEAAYATEYKIFVSRDTKEWQEVAHLENQDGKIDEVEFPLVKAQFVKLQGLKRFNSEWGISMWEVDIFGPKELNPEDKTLAEIYPDREDGTSLACPVLLMEEPLASPGEIYLNEFQKGVVYTSWSRDELATLVSDKTIEYLYDLGVRNIGIMVVWFQDTVSSKEIYPDTKKDTVTDEALSHAVNKAHSLGMKVTLKPHVDVREGDWRGDIIPSEEWFKAYKNFILYYAKIASMYNIELFCIGTELVNTTNDRWQKQWYEIIDSIKNVYKGRLTYSSNWNEYKQVFFWKKLDFIGIDAYFPLTAENNPTLENLITAWKSYANQIESWLKEKDLNKPVIFTEIGYSSADGTNKNPWQLYSHLSLDKVDEKEQADCLQSLLIVMKEKTWFKGLYWWNYFPQVRWSPLGFTIRGKLAEKLLSEWFKKRG